MSPESRPHDGCSFIWVGTLGQMPAHKVTLPAVSGFRQVQGGPCGLQNFGCFLVVQRKGYAQCIAVLAAGVDISPGGQQQPHDLGVAAPGRRNQGSCAVFVGRIHFCSDGQQ